MRLTYSSREVSCSNQGSGVVRMVSTLSRSGGDLRKKMARWALRGAVSALVFLGVRAVYRWLRGREGIGLGDVKLAGVAGAWLDWPIIPIAIEIAAVAALGAYLIRHFCFRRAVRPTTRMPFGLFLAPAIWIGWFLETTLLLYPSVSSF